MKNLQVNYKLFHFLLLFMCLAANSFSQDAENLTKKKSLINLVNSTTPYLMEEFNTPGVAVLIIHNNEIILKKSFGLADVESKKPITNKTLFNLASISKPVTAWGIMKLVEQGKLDLDKPVQGYLTRRKFPPSEFNELVTTRLLLNHSSGLVRGAFPSYKKGEKVPSLIDALNGKNTNNENVAIVYKPGTDTRYSSIGFGVLQLLIEEISGKSFEEFMQTEILQPLEMKEATFTDSTSPQNVNKIATPYSHSGNPFPQERFIETAAGGLLANIDDISTFALAELKLKHYSNVLTSESIDLMHQIAKPSDKMGLGHIVRKIDGTKIVGHTGANNGWRQTFQMIPETGDTIVVLTNGDNGEFLHSELTCHWFKELNGKEIEECKTASNERFRVRMFKFVIGIGTFVFLIGVLGGIWFLNCKKRNTI